MQTASTQQTDTEVEAYLARADAVIVDVEQADRQRLLDHVRAQVELELDLAAASPHIPGSISDALTRLGPPGELVARARAALNLSSPPVLSPPVAGLAGCRVCKREVAAVAALCPHCGAPRPADARWNGAGYEYRSRAEWRGMPLVHVAFGRDAHGKLRVARGVVAVGQFARGVVVVAQFGAGSLFGLGQFIAAPIAVAQFAVGLVCVGQIAAAALFGLGMVATGLRAVGAAVLRF